MREKRRYPPIDRNEKNVNFVDENIILTIKEFWGKHEKELIGPIITFIGGLIVFLIKISEYLYLMGRLSKYHIDNSNLYIGEDWLVTIAEVIIVILLTVASNFIFYQFEKYRERKYSKILFWIEYILISICIYLSLCLFCEVSVIDLLVELLKRPRYLVSTILILPLVTLLIFNMLSFCYILTNIITEKEKLKIVNNFQKNGYYVQKKNIEKPHSRVILLIIMLLTLLTLTIAAWMYIIYSYGAKSEDNKTGYKILILEDGNLKGNYNQYQAIVYETENLYYTCPIINDGGMNRIDSEAMTTISKGETITTYYFDDYKEIDITR